MNAPTDAPGGPTETPDGPTHDLTDTPDDHAALYGKDDTPRIVGIHPLLDRTAEPHAVVRVYRRSGDGRTVSAQDEAFYPFFFLGDVEHLRGFSRRRFRFQELSGENAYRFVVVFSTWRAYMEARRHVESAAGEAARYVIPSAAQQYLVQSGRTFFKGMAFDELHRLQLDIETYSEAEFSNARRPADRILLVALSDNRGWSHLVDGRELSEADMLRRTAELLRERDPDVIEGHNILGFDLPYIVERCRRHGVSFDIGRDGRAPRTFSSTMRFAERAVDYTAFDIAGRHVIDTYFQVLSYDVVKRDMPSYGLKAAARYFGFAAENRTYVRGDDISRIWREDPDRLARYAMDDVVETERLARHLSGSTFYLTQIVPMPYGRAARTGPAAKIESLFIREYLRRKHSIPRGEVGSQSTGGYTDILFTGVTGPIVYADVESLYPSIMLQYDVRPEQDALGLFHDLLQRLTDLRLRTKRAMEDAETDESRSELDARQGSYKVLINSFYGQLGFGQALFNDFSEADRVAEVGQELLRALMRRIWEDGGRVIEVDTDGVLFVPPEHVTGEDAERTYVEALSGALPEGIRVGFEGRFRKMLSYKKKNYALVHYDGTLTFKGSSLVSRSVERFGRRFVRRAIRMLLEDDVEGLHALYLETRQAIVDHDWKSVQSFSRTETLKDTVRQYRVDVERGRRPKAAAYELATARAERSGRPVRKGDRITYYVTGQSPTVTTFENCRLADEWDAGSPDENTAYYLKRLDEFARKFETFFLPHDFRLVFSPEDMFGFSARDVALQSHERAIEPFLGG
ncbi:MAG: DNA polymerase domain-containing protein [Rhodothermales bacterium]